MPRARARPSALGYVLSPGIALVLFSTPLIHAQLPSIKLYTVFPPGGRVGETVEVEIGGADLDEADGLIFSHPGIGAVQKTGSSRPFADAPTPVPNRFIVTIDGGVPEGVYEVRASGRFGVSNPRAFAVGHLAEAVENEPNNGLEQVTPVGVGTTVNGRVNGGTDVDYFRFAASAGQRVVIDCAAQRIDSVLDGVLVLFRAGGEEISRSRAGRRRDPVLAFTAPEDGDYTVRLGDVTYRGGGEFFYRLSISSDPHVFLVEPPCGAPGTRSRYTLYGVNLPGGAPVEGLEVEGVAIEALAVDIQLPWEPVALSLERGLADSREAAIDGIEYRLTTPRGATNAVFIGFAAEPIVLEREPNDEPAQAQKVPAPCEVAGRFYPGLDRDWFEFDARAGEVYWIEVVSQRMGLATDPQILVHEVKRNENGEESVREVARVDDLGGGGGLFVTESDDAAHRLTVGADATYRVMVHDLHGVPAGDLRDQYRLAVRRERPDFRLAAVPRPSVADKNQALAVWNPLLRRGEVVCIDVIALRRDGFDGEIRVSVEGLPAGVSCREAVIGRGKRDATLLLEAAGDVADWYGPARIVGRARIGEWEVERVARSGAVVWPPRDGLGHRARVVRDTSLAVSAADGLPLGLDAGGAVLEMCRGGALEIPLAIERHTGFHGKLGLGAVELPPNVQVKGVSLDEGKKEGETKLVLQLKKEAAPGEYLFCLQANAEFDFSRNPQAAERAKRFKERIDAGVAELEGKSAEAASRKEALVSAVAEAETAVAAAAAELEAARKADAEAAGAVKAAAAREDAARAGAAKLAGALEGAAAEAAKTLAAKAEAARAAREAAEKKAGGEGEPGDGGQGNPAGAAALRKAAEEAAAAAADAAAKLAALAKEAAVAAKELEEAGRAAEEAAAAAGVAAEALVAAEQAQGPAATKLAEVTAARDAAEAERKRLEEEHKAAVAARDAAAKEAEAAAKAAEPKKIKDVFLTRTLTLRITEAPVAFTGQGPGEALAGEVARGAAVELPVRIDRRYGFEGPVTVKLALPGEAKGVKVGDITIPEKGTEGILKLEAAADAAEGVFTATLRAAVKFNNQDLETTTPLRVTVGG